MQQQIKTMLNMERIDLEIERLRGELEYYPEKINQLEKDIEQKNAVSEEREAGLSEAREERKVHEEEIAFEEDRLRGLKSKMMDVKTNAEYQAIMREIEHIKRVVNQKEEGALKYIEQIENEEKLINEEQQQVKQLEEEIEKLRGEWQQKKEEIAKEIGNYQAERDSIGSSLETAVAAKYKLIKQRRPGAVLAIVSNGICGACHMNIPPQLYNEILQLRNLHNCPNCFSILYPKIEEEEK